MNDENIYNTRYYFGKYAIEHKNTISEHSIKCTNLTQNMQKVREISTNNCDE